MIFSFNVILYNRGLVTQNGEILSVPHGINTTFFLPTYSTQLFFKEVPYLSTDYISFPEMNITSH